MCFAFFSAEIPRATGMGFTMGIETLGAVPAGGRSGCVTPNQRIYGVRRTRLAVGLASVASSLMGGLASMASSLLVVQVLWEGD